MEAEEDIIFRELERDDDDLLEVIREQRQKFLSERLHKLSELKYSGCGTYSELRTEKDILDLTTSMDRVVVHFSQASFTKCNIMDRHLEKLAAKYYDTRFVKLEAVNAPFLIVKLKVQVLPCVICFVKAISVDRIIGFEGLGSDDNFPTTVLESRLLLCRVIKKNLTSNRNIRASQDKSDSDSE